MSDDAAGTRPALADTSRAAAEIVYHTPDPDRPSWPACWDQLSQPPDPNALDRVDAPADPGPGEGQWCDHCRGGRGQQSALNRTVQALHASQVGDTPPGSHTQTEFGPDGWQPPDRDGDPEEVAD